MSGSRSLISLLLAFALLHALPSAASAQQSDPPLPQIRLTPGTGVADQSGRSSSTFGADEIYVCAGPAWQSCQTKVIEKIRVDLGWSPEREDLGGKQIRWGGSNAVDLGGVGSFALFGHFRSGGPNGMPEWVAYQVEVQLGDTVAAPFSGTVLASGALAPVNGLTVTQGQRMFVIVPSTTPPFVDLDLTRVWFGLPQPGAPGVGISYKCSPIGRRCP